MGLGRTGVVGVIHGRKGTAGKTIGLRADMDALPIEEANNLPYNSTVPGKMHACGHDGHTAMLLGAARYLTETRNFAGTAVVIFQPAEEGGGGGREMVYDGLMDRFNIREVYGMHNYPGMPVGSFGIRPGPMMAAADALTIDIDGVGAHAARPHLGIDTVLVGAQIINAIQSVVARNVDPLKSAVVSICMFRAGNADNVIPQTVQLRGTARSLAPDVRDLLEKLPDHLKDDPSAKLLREATQENTITVVHLIYKSKNYESSSKDYDFSHVAMLEHWESGVRDVYASMRHKEWLERPQSGETMVTYDLSGDESPAKKE